MKVLYVHNKYSKPSGEEHAAGELVALIVNFRAYYEMIVSGENFFVARFRRLCRNFE